MEHSYPSSPDPEITESLSATEFDTESESFHATYDSTRDPTSLAVIAAVATVLGEDPQALTPLQSVIDTDALDELATESATSFGACDSISFRYDGFEITVTSEGGIEVKPVENTKSAPKPPYRIECASCGMSRTGRKRTSDSTVVPYQDTCSECGCENFDIGVTTENE